MINLSQAYTKFLSELLRQGSNPRAVENLEPIMKKIGSTISNEVDGKSVTEFSKFYQAATNYMPGHGDEVVSVIGLVLNDVRVNKVPKVVQRIEKIGVDAYLDEVISKGSRGKGWLARLFG